MISVTKLFTVEDEIITLYHPNSHDISHKSPIEEDNRPIIEGTGYFTPIVSLEGLYETDEGIVPRFVLENIFQRRFNHKKK